jgi:hypothetical protein
MHLTTKANRIGVVLALVSALATCIPHTPAHATHEDGYPHDEYGRPPDDYGYRHDDRRHRHDDDRYVFATTRGLNAIDMHPAFKIPAWPAAFIIDLVFLPFAVIADATNQ